MKKSILITIAALAIIGLGGCVMDSDASSDRRDITASEPAMGDESIEVAQAPVAPDATGTETPAVPSAAAASADRGSVVSEEEAENAPEVTTVSGQLVNADGTPVSGGVAYFVFQGRLNEIPHTNPLDKVMAMTEKAVAVDTEGSFTLRIKPGNFAMVYSPAATEVPAEPGPESMAAMRRLSPEQVQARIAAIKENAAKGLPIKNGKLGEAFVIENRFVRPPISDFGELQLQSNAVATVKALDENDEPINFPATLRLRGKNGDIMEPHTPSINTRAQYSFHDIMPQSYQVFALGTLPRPGAGDEVTTPVVTNDQFVFTGEPLTHEVVVEPGSSE